MVIDQYDQAELAKRWDVSQAGISRYRTGGRKPSIRVLCLIAAEGINLHWLLTGEGEMRIKPRVHPDPVYIVAEGKESYGENKPIDAIKITDDAMEPILRAGDLAAVNCDQKDPKKLDGKLAAVDHAGRLTVRRIATIEKNILLYPENIRKHGTERLDGKIIGAVEWLKLK